MDSMPTTLAPEASIGNDSSKIAQISRQMVSRQIAHTDRELERDVLL